MFVDTQVVSYAMKGRWSGSLAQLSLASIVANEFLMVQSDNPNHATYYVPHPSRISDFGAALQEVDKGDRSPPLLSRRDHPFRKQSTDSVVMEFGLLHPPIVEYGNFAISALINNRKLDLFAAAVKFLEKNSGSC